MIGNPPFDPRLYRITPGGKAHMRDSRQQRTLCGWKVAKRFFPTDGALACRRCSREAVKRIEPEVPAD